MKKELIQIAKVYQKRTNKINFLGSVSSCLEQILPELEAVFEKKRMVPEKEGT